MNALTTPRKKIFVPSFDFKPQLGGVAHYVHELMTVLHNEYHCDIHILARQAANASTYDKSSPFQITRIQTPNMAALALPQWALAVWRLQKQLKPNAIFCPLWFPDASAVFLAQKWGAPKTPYFIAAHAMEVVESEKTLKHHLRKKLIANLKQQTLLGAEKIFPVSRYTKDLILQITQTPANKLCVANNGINTQIYKPLAVPTKDRFFKRTKNLLTVTRLNAYKGVDMVLRALPALLKQGLEIKYRIVGTGSDLERLKKLAADLSLNNHVEFLGALSQDQIIEHYNAADLFVLLSREELPDVEGFGLVFLEAAACGLPSLGGASGGIPDAIDNEKSGWLVNPTDLAQIEQQLFLILSDPQKLAISSAYCLQMVKQRSWSQTAQIITGEMRV
jgi:phosphatidyl-myo-inositol dimannoside synthase